ncbi:MAG TPA: adenine deaminase [Spirochaetota bacterium]|nr:adenine deaminase [Spirochaetota bacterium]HOM88125.1 adenine deaminase [Spirochaetota bacterium]HOR93686.1 adenine deaminase [Spirochaetota bacterium]HPK44299.1 adenine deaminase [Spirochaetota bacterium]HRR61542.1 adenine deaminase [Spirochaetota bacterium]
MNFIPLETITMELADVAMGRRKADMVIKNGTLVNVNTKELQEHIDVALYKGRIALVGDASHCIGETTQIIDATGLYIAPGFMDGHIHVESSMLTVSQYSTAVVPHGTTAIFMDPHEIANVLGLKGVKLMLDEARDVPLRVYATVPSCVPAAQGLEDAGAEIGPEEIAEAMKWDAIAGLGELMNFPGVFNSVPDVHKEIAVTLKAGKPVTGHFALPDTGKMLNAYIASGVRSCHESVRHEDALAKMRLGMYAKIREGSAWHDLKEVIKAITHNTVQSRFAILVSDDTHPDTLIKLGHLDHIVKRAIEEGVDPVTAIEMVTINTAECFLMSKDFGSVSPSKVADIVLLSDLYSVTVKAVIIGGRLVARDGTMLSSAKKVTYPDWSKNTVNVGKTLTPQDFMLTVNKSEVKVRVIQIEEAKVTTKQVIETLKTIDGNVAPNKEKDIAKAALFERHKATGTKGLGFVKGFGLKKGAVASTVAHDSHNLLIVGTDEEDMAFAGNELIKAGGGMIAVADGKVLAIVELPVAGLLTDEPVEAVQKKVETLEKAWKMLGCNLVSPFMTMALLGLPVIPELRLSNRGLVDAVNFTFTDVIAG